MKGFRRIARSASIAVLAFSIAACDSLFNSVLPASPGEVERQLFNAVNSKRNEAGLAALIWSDLIAEEARTHSTDMADKTVPFGHDGFSDRFARITRAIPADAGAENIAYGPDADTVFRIWADSAGHRAHIVGNFDFTGVGVAWDSKSSSFYCTQIFIRSR
jgi:uncharacterized protein YkwD